MSAEIDTMRLLEHLDGKFAEADRKRSAGLEIVHRKLDEIRTETTDALGGIHVEIGKHDLRIASIEGRVKTDDAKAEGRLLAAAKILLTGGGLAAVFEALRGRLAE